MIESPLVSILVASYNHEKYIEDCLKGIINQTYSNIELIICDDCSSDKTVLIIEKYLLKLKKKFPTVIFEINSINLGLVKNHIKLGNMATGKYMLFLAGDDVPLPGFIEASTNYMERHSKYDMCYSDEYIVPESFRFNDDPKSFIKYQKPGTARSGFNLFEDLILGRMWLGATSAFLKTESFHYFGGFDPDIDIEDTNLWLTIARLGGIGHFNDCLMCYRQSENSASNLNSINKKEKFMKAYNAEVKTYLKHSVYLKNENLTNKVMSHIYKKYFITAMELDLREESIELYKEIKKNDIKLSVKLRLHWILYFFHLSKIYVFLQNTKKNRESV